MRQRPTALSARVGRVAIQLLLVAGLVTAGGCSRKEPYVPPDLFYLFATYTVGKNPTSVTTADFNQDGLTDLITTNIGNSTLSVLFGYGDGTFKEQIQIEAGKEPRALALSDFNADGHVDVAVACSGSDQVAIFFGLANGTFGVGQRYAMHKIPVSIASGDVNGDHKSDLIVALRNDKVSILLGNGDGTFVEGARYEYGDTPTSLAVADLNQDGKLDLAVTNGGPMSSAVSIWLGNGDGTFRQPTDYRTGKRPLSVSFADFNNDQKTDLLVINGEMDTFTIFLGNGNGTFQEGKESGADSGPVYGFARDFNGDGFVDVAIVNVQSNDLSILFGRGDGTFQYPPINYRTKGGPFAIATLNLTTKHQDEEPGLVTANNGAGSISIFLHRGLKPHAPPVPPASS
ncbi:MAG: VCBS repeat-containing protein [Nitrospirae bacterium]|nr:VCBS repeat-containing protein [Nitrospirota bacterium]